MKTVPSAIQDWRYSHTSFSSAKSFKILPDTLYKSTSLQQKESKHHLYLSI